MSVSTVNKFQNTKQSLISYTPLKPLFFLSREIKSGKIIFFTYTPLIGTQSVPYSRKLIFLQCFLPDQWFTVCLYSCLFVPQEMIGPCLQSKEGTNEGGCCASADNLLFHPLRNSVSAYSIAMSTAWLCIEATGPRKLWGQCGTSGILNISQSLPTPAAS